MHNSLFKYGFCRDNCFSVLCFLLKMFISKIHVCLPSGQNIVLPFDLLHSFMYIHAIELTVGQLLAFLHVPIRVKFTTYCLLFCNCRDLNTAIVILCFIYLIAALNFQYFSSALHFDLNPIVLYTVLSLDLFFQYFMTVYLNLPLLTLLLIHVFDINSSCKFYIWLHLADVAFPTFVLILMLIFLLSVSIVTFLCLVTHHLRIYFYFRFTFDLVLFNNY